MRLHHGAFVLLPALALAPTACAVSTIELIHSGSSGVTAPAVSADALTIVMARQHVVDACSPGAGDTRDLLAMDLREPCARDIVRELRSFQDTAGDPAVTADGEIIVFKHVDGAGRWAIDATDRALASFANVVTEAPGATVSGLDVTPSGTHVTYLATRNGTVDQVMVAPMSGSGATVLDSAPAGWLRLNNNHPVADDATVYYSKRGTAGGPFAIYKRSPADLSPTQVTFDYVDHQLVAVAASGTRWACVSTTVRHRQLL